MDLNLQSKNWKEFVFEDIFEITSTSSSIDRNKLITKAGEIPYITRSEKNNGYDSFVGTQSEKYSLDEGNVITIGLDTQSVFYQPKEFYTGQNIQVLKSKYLTKDVAQFLIPLIKRQMGKFNWGGNGATLTRLKRSKILLPADSEGKPDYAFMEAYMKDVEQKMLGKYKQFIEKRLTDLSLMGGVRNLDGKEWREFYIGDLFNLSQGKSKGLNHLMKAKDGINYLGATNLNNGVLTQVIEVKKLVHKGNAIAFIRNGEGSMGYSVYKSEDFIASSDISVGYSKFLSRHTGIFITTIADKVRGKYNFGYKRSDRRLKKEKIMLPVNQTGTPDYEFMENYMKRLEYEKLSKYLSLKYSYSG